MSTQKPVVLITGTSSGLEDCLRRKFRAERGAPSTRRCARDREEREVGGRLARTRRAELAADEVMEMDVTDEAS